MAELDGCRRSARSRYDGQVRWAFLVCAGCGRLAFDERVTPDAPAMPDGPAISCTTDAFDQVPAGFVKNGNGDVAAINGQLRFMINGQLDSEAYLELAAPTSFVGRSTAIQAVAPSPTQSASTAMGWHEKTGDQIGIHLEYDGFNLKLNRYNPTLDQYDELESLPYDAVEFAWWRLSDGGNGVIVAEVSRDGVAWNPFGTVPATDITTMTWDFGLGSFVGNIAPSESALDNAIDCVP